MDIAINTGATLFEQNFSDFVIAVKNAGFDSLMLNIDSGSGGLDWDSLSKGIIPKDNYLYNQPSAIYNKLKPQLDIIYKNGLKISQAHAPCSAKLITSDELILFITEVYKNCIGFCQLAGIKHLIIHGFCKENFDSTHTYEDIKNINMQMFTSLIPYLENTDVTVCLENIFYVKGKVAFNGICADPYEANEYIDTLNSLCKDKKHFGLCLDIGHILVTRTEINHYLSIVGDRVVNTHSHDNDGVSDLHATPFAGYMNWDFILKALIKHGYKGDLCLETYSYIEKLPKPLQVPFITFSAKTANYFRDVLNGKITLK